MNVIHMDVEVTKDAADAINAKVSELAAIQQKLDGAANSIESGWTSDKATNYRTRIKETAKAITNSLNALGELAVQMRMEVAQWQEADVMGVTNLEDSWSVKGAWNKVKSVFGYGDKELKGDSKKIEDILKKLKETDEGKKLFEEMKKNNLGFSIDGKRVFGDKDDKIIPILSANLTGAYGSYSSSADVLKLDLASFKNNKQFMGTMAHEMTHALDDQKGNLTFTMPGSALAQSDIRRFQEQINNMATVRVNSEVRAHEIGYELKGEAHKEITYDGTIKAGERDFVMDSAERNYSATYTRDAQANLPKGYTIKGSFDEANNRVTSTVTNNNTHPPTVTTVP